MLAIMIQGQLPLAAVANTRKRKRNPNVPWNESIENETRSIRLTKRIIGIDENTIADEMMMMMMTTTTTIRPENVVRNDGERTARRAAADEVGGVRAVMILTAVNFKMSSKRSDLLQNWKLKRQQ